MESLPCSFTYSFWMSSSLLKQARPERMISPCLGSSDPGMASGRNFLSCTCGSGDLGDSKSEGYWLSSPSRGRMAPSEANLWVMCLSVPNLLWAMALCLSALSSGNRKINSDATFFARSQVISRKMNIQSDQKRSTAFQSSYISPKVTFYS